MFNSCTWINYFIHISQKIYLNEYDLRQIITEQWSPKTCNSSSVRPRHFCFPVSCDFDFYHSIHKSSLIEAAIIVFVLNYIKCLTFKYFNISCTNQDQSPWGIQFFFLEFSVPSQQQSSKSETSNPCKSLLKCRKIKMVQTEYINIGLYLFIFLAKKLILYHWMFIYWGPWS